MKRKNDRLVALLGAVLCACACLAGCERKASASPETSVSNASAASSAPVVPNAPAAVTASGDSNAQPVKQEQQVPSRADDAAYQSQVLRRDEEKSLNGERERIRRLMEQVRARAREKLPKGATDAEVTAEIEKYPEIYRSWEKYKKALVQIDEAVERRRKATGTTIRRLNQREVAGQNSAKQ